jgi:elongator complex protein 6
MPPSTRIPPLLQPYVHLPRDDSLLLLTSTLGASANWLLIRFLCDALSNTPQDGGEEGHNVVLVSWMREYEFWKQEARKGAGLDLERLRNEGKLAFVDGLGAGRDAPEEQNNVVGNESRARGLNGARIPSGPQSPSARAPQTLPVRGPPGRIVPARGPPLAAPASPAAVAAPTTAASAVPASTNTSTPGHYTLKALELADLKTAISSAVSSLSTSTATSPTTQRKTLLILDNPDLLLALNPTITPSSFTSLILDSLALPTVSHVLTHIQSDNPLLSLSTPPQPLEWAHHNLLVKCAHMSRRILGVRVLDTGVARDVSGVVRITEQKSDWLNLGLDDAAKNGDDGGKGKEFLYEVKGDGSVRVFERGAGGEG